jgi:bile acid:Na+ symporter, BASS family
MTRLLHWLQRRMLWLLLSTYALGAWVPRLGLSIRHINAGVVHFPGGAAVELSLPMLMLGFLLVVACLGSNLRQLKHTFHRPGILVAGLAANALYPIVFALIVSIILRAWHNPTEAQNILVGLAMIGAMPIAGASTAWTQNADGNLALSLGLVLASTVLSPIVTPLGLHAIGAVTSGDYSEDLHELAHQGSSAFLALAVVGPSALGILLRLVLGAQRATRILPALKAINLVDLLMLNYANAAATLPQIVHTPDWDFLAVTMAITVTMCAGAFVVGWWLPRLFRAESADQTALMFGLGMNNNGTGLVLAGQALADHPLVMLPIIFYNLMQQMVAGSVDILRRHDRT